MPFIKQGEDIEVTLNVKSGGAVFDLTGYNVVVVVYSNRQQVLGRFSNNSFTDSKGREYSSLTVTDAVNGVVDIVVTNEMTKESLEGNMWAVVKLRETSSDTYTEADAVKIGTVKQSVATEIEGF